MIPYPYLSLKMAFESDDHYFTHCPFHKDTNASFCINKRNLGAEKFKQELYYKCFGCGKCGTAKDFAYRYLGHDKKSIQINLYGQADVSSPVKEIIRPKINWETMRGFPLEHIPDEEQQLAFKVGVSVETIRKFKIGWRDYKFLIPLYDDRGICGIAVRSYGFDNKEGWICKKRCIRGSKHGWFYALNQSFKITDPIFVTEGWSDTAVITELGLHSIGRFNALHIDEHIELSDKPYVYIISDTDECGIEGARKLQDLIGGKITYPSQYDGKSRYKDIREMYLDIGKEATKKWIEEQL